MKPPTRPGASRLTAPSNATPADTAAEMDEATLEPVDILTSNTSSFELLVSPYNDVNVKALKIDHKLPIITVIKMYSKVENITKREVAKASARVRKLKRTGLVKSQQAKKKSKVKVKKSVNKKKGIW